MSDETTPESASESVGAPRHFWAVGVFAVLWNAMGAFDYIATQLRLDFYMSGFTPEQLDYFYGFPAWLDGAWAIAVWTGLLGSVLLLLRWAWAFWAFGLSLIAMFATFTHNFILSEGLEMVGVGPAVFSVIIVLIGAALLAYSRAMTKSGVLR